MVQASHKVDAEEAILRTLQRGPLPYNKLFKKLSKDIGSLHTFEKYLQDLEKRHLITRESNPEDARSVLLELAGEETTKFLDILQGFRDFEAIAEGFHFLHGPNLYNIQEGHVINLIRVTHSLYSHLHEDKIPLDAYFSVGNEGPEVRLISRSRFSELLSKEAELDRLVTD